MDPQGLSASLDDHYKLKLVISEGDRKVLYDHMVHGRGGGYT